MLACAINSQVWFLTCMWRSIFPQDTCTGFLLGGIGEINNKRQPNFLVVNKGMASYRIEGRERVHVCVCIMYLNGCGYWKACSLLLVVMLYTCSCEWWMMFLLLFFHYYSLSLSLFLPPLPLSPHTDTSVSDIEEAFKSFTTRTDINVLLINQHVRALAV